MLDTRTVAENLDEIRRSLARRSEAAAQSLAGLGELAKKRVELITTTEQLQARRNAANQGMTKLAKGGDKAAFQARRDELKAHLAQCGVGTEIYYPIPMHLQESFAFLGYHGGDFPHSEQAAAQSLALPIYPELTEAMQTRVVETILDFYRA